jgi:NAD(P)-dependent dehydrogenase (short-subunit alcohol dehydrogenase family)
MIFSPQSFSGRHMLVTGASSGIGRQTALRLSEAGARVLLVGRDEKRLGDAFACLSGEGHALASVELSDADGTTEAINKLAKEHGTLDGMFHAAGAGGILPIKVTKNRHLDEMFGAGFRGAFGVVRAATRAATMNEGGAVVLMSSVSSIRGRPGMASYAAAKAAVDGMVRVAAAELAGRAIRVNSLIAGAIETEMHKSFTETMSAEMIEDYRALHLLGFGGADDVAYAAMYLLSDAARWVTGTGLVIDGGFSAT